MRMVPSEMPPLATDADPRVRSGHKGEAKVFGLLEELDRPGFVTVQTPLHDHDFKKVAEADFIVVADFVRFGVTVLVMSRSPPVPSPTWTPSLGSRSGVGVKLNLFLQLSNPVGLSSVDSFSAVVRGFSFKSGHTVCSIFIVMAKDGAVRSRTGMALNIFVTI